MRVPFPTTLPKLDLVSLFPRDHSLSGVVVPNCSFQLQFLNDDNDEHIFMCFFAMTISSLMKYLLRSFVNLSMSVSVFFLLTFDSLLCVQVLYQIHDLPIFPFSQWLAFSQDEVLHLIFSNLTLWLQEIMVAFRAQMEAYRSFMKCLSWEFQSLSSSFSFSISSSDIRSNRPISLYLLFCKNFWKYHVHSHPHPFFL